MVNQAFKAITILAFLIICLLSFSFSCFAQDYQFRVQKNESHIYIMPNGGVTIEYSITFENLGKLIDVVDIGLPNNNYDLTSAQAYIDGQRVGPVAKSTYIPIGVEVQLGNAVLEYALCARMF